MDPTWTSDCGTVKNMANMRADGVSGSTAANHVARSGSIPASALSFYVGKDDDAKELIMKHHYSRRYPSNVQLVGTLHLPGGLFGDCGKCVAAVTYSIPPTRWSEDVLELSRLVRGSERVPLTLLIRLSCLRLKRMGWDLVVSFADETQGHKGIVYRAAGWNYGGLREGRLDGLIVGGQFIPGRTCNHVYGTRSPSRLLERHGIESTPHYDDGKHLYWRALTASGRAKAERLGLNSQPLFKEQIRETQEEMF